MSDLLKKLNVLVKASLNDLTGSQASERRAEPTPKLGADYDRDVATLRGRINEAIAYEDQLKARVGQLEDEVDRWDATADDAVTREDDVSARYAIEQMQRARQRLVLANNDLRAHQRVTQELVTRVNTLEAALADARRARAADPTQPEPELGGLTDVLKEARERMAALTDLLKARDEVAQDTPAPPLADDRKIDDDLSQRRQRLSK